MSITIMTDTKSEYYLDLMDGKQFEIEGRIFRAANLIIEALPPDAVEEMINLILLNQEKRALEFINTRINEGAMSIAKWLEKVAPYPTT